MRPDQQRMLAIALLIVAVLLLAVSSGLIVYAIGSNQPVITTRTIVTFPTSTPTPTPDDGFNQFLVTFSQALTTNDLATISYETDQDSFNDSQTMSFILGYDWSHTYVDLQSGLLSLTIHRPFLYSCQQHYRAYASHAVMGTYTLQSTASITASGGGYAVLVFEQLEQGSSWYWVGLTLNGYQCKQP